MQIVSNARKLLLRPPDGPVVSFPPGAKISEYGANNYSPVVVVFNATDPSWQGAGPDDFVIINEVPGEVAAFALETHETVGLQAALYFLVASDCGDQYTTKTKFVRENLSPAGRMLDDGSGLMKRDERDLVSLSQNNGEFFVDQGEGPRKIEPDILLRTYRNPDGSNIDLREVPESQ